MATLSLTEGGEGLPLQLTTITVAVPASPLSPNTGSMLGVAGVSGQVTPLTVPVSMTDTNFKWKYEQPKTDKAGTTLVSCRELPISTIMSLHAPRCTQQYHTHRLHYSVPCSHRDRGE